MTSGAKRTSCVSTVRGGLQEQPTTCDDTPHNGAPPPAVRRPWLAVLTFSRTTLLSIINYILDSHNIISPSQNCILTSQNSIADIQNVIVDV